MRLLKNINYALDSIVNKLLFSIIIIIQLTTSILFLYNGMLFTEQNSKNIEKIESTFSTTKLFKVNDVDELDNLFKVKLKEKNILTKLVAFENFLQNSEEFTCIRFNNDPIAIEKFNGSSSFIINTSQDFRGKDKTFTRVYALQGDESFFKNFKFTFSEGRYFEGKDFEAKENIPVILGYDYSNIYKVGDRISFCDNISGDEKQLEVIGFLSKDCYFYQKTFSPSSTFNMNNYIIYPMQKYNISSIGSDSVDEEKLADRYISDFFSTMLISNKDEKYLQNLIQEKSDTLNLYNIEIQSGENLLNSFKDMCETQKQFSLIIFFIVFFFTSINMVTSLCNYVSQRRKEFGVHIMCGATMGDLCQRVFFQILILMSLSFAFMISVNGILNKGSIKPSVDTKILILTGITCIILVIVLAVIPLIKLSEMKINEIIKED